MPSRLTDKQRWQIQYLRSQGHSNSFIARKIGCTRKTVRRWTKKGLGDIKENVRFDQYLKVSRRKKQRIVHEVLHTCTSLRKLAWKYNLSHMTVHKIIKNHSPEDPIKPYKLTLTPKLSGRQKQLR